MKVGFIGLGLLGKSIATRLISQGIDLIVWNRTKAKAEDLNAEMAESPAEVISNVDTVFLNLSDSNAVFDVIYAPEGLLEGKFEGKTIIDTTTNHFDKVLEFHNIFKSKGAYYLEVPVIGSVMPALKGNLINRFGKRRQKGF